MHRDVPVSPNEAIVALTVIAVDDEACPTSWNEASVFWDPARVVLLNINYTTPLHYFWGSYTRVTLFPPILLT